MDAIRWDALLDWISRHPLAAGIVIFLIAFGDALLIVGVAIPATPLLFAVGTLVGLGHIDGTYAVLCAALGAFCGDGVSYLAGRRYGDSLKTRWPFAQNPHWLERGDAAFRRLYPAVRPDAEVWVNGRLYYLELDRGTMGYAQIERRFRKYEGCPHLSLWVCATPNRAEGLRRRAEGVRGSALFATRADVLAAPHGEVWTDFAGGRASLPREGDGTPG